MGNPILDMFNSQKNVPSGLPTSMDDPRMKDAIDYVNSHGGDPKQAFFQLCKERMLNPGNIMNMLMGK